MSGERIFQSEIERARSRLRELFGDETFLAFRNDMRELFIEYHDVDDVSDFKKRKWVQMGRTGIDETRSRYLTFETGLNILNLSDALLSITIGYAVNSVALSSGLPQIPSKILGILVTLGLYSMNTGLVFAKALVTEIAYPPNEIHTRLDVDELRFRAGWNKGVIQSSASMIGIIFYGVLTNPGSRGYNWGLRIVEWWLKIRFDD